MTWPTQPPGSPYAQPYPPRHAPGYPPPPWAGQPDRLVGYPTPPPPKKKRGGVIAVVVALVILLPLILGGIFLLVIRHQVSPGTPGHASGTMKVAWSVPAVKGNTTGIALAGSWLTDKYIVDGRPDGLVAYAIGTGQQQWGTQAPDGLRACAMSATPSQNIGIVGYGADQYTCDKVAAIDLTSGQQLWRVDLADHGKFPTRLSDPSVSVSGDVVAVRTSNTVETLNLTDGKQIWTTPKPQGLSAVDCTPQGVAAGASLVYALESCLSNSGSKAQLVAFNRSGPSPVWTSPLPGRPEGYRIVAAEPLVVVDTSTKQAYSFANGQTPVNFSLSDLSYDVFTETSLARQPQLLHACAIVGKVLYAEGTIQKPLSNSIVAIDLSTGKQLWTKSLGQSVLSTIISADAKGVHAITEESGQNTYQLVTYAAATGQVSYGTAAHDSRFTFTAEDMLYLAPGGYLIDLPAATSMAQREIIVLSNAS